MRLSISNIAWTTENDEKVYYLMKDHDYEGLEIAPTKIIPENPYDNIEQIKIWSADIKQKYGFNISSMQSIWYNRQERLFGEEKERLFLLEYTKKAIDFANSIDCGNIVFGCPRNRVIKDRNDYKIAVDFFRELGEYSASKKTVIGLEANPPMYNTNFINDTDSAIELIKEVGSEGFKLNLDVGTMLENHETINILRGNEAYINHVHISEPGLKTVISHSLHEELKDLLYTAGYTGYISVEMGKTDDLNELKRVMDYVHKVFYDI